MVGDEPLFETGSLSPGPVDPANIHRQLSGWVRGGACISPGGGFTRSRRPQRSIYTPSVANRLIPGPYIAFSAWTHFSLSDPRIGPGGDKHHDQVAEPVRPAAGRLRIHS